MVRGYRFPWVNNFGIFVVLGILSGFLAIWLVLQVTRHLKMSRDPFVYARVACALFLLMIVGAVYLGPRLALYPALGLLLFSLGVVVRQPVAKLVLIVAAPYPVLRLIFHESLGLIQRIIVQTIPEGGSRNAVYDLAYVVFFTLVSLPFVYGFAATYVESRQRLVWVDRFRSTSALVAVSVAIVAVGLSMMNRPVYDRLWHSAVRAEQRFVLGSDSSRITVKGAEYLNGLQVRMDGTDTLITGRTTFCRLEPREGSVVHWCAVERESQSGVAPNAGDSLSSIERNVHIRSQVRPLRVRMWYRSSDPIEVSSPWSDGPVRGRMRESSREKVFTWYSYPDTSLLIPLTFRMHNGQRIAESIEVTYDSLAYPLRVSREFTNIVQRTIVTAEDTLQTLPSSQFASHRNTP